MFNLAAAALSLVATVFPNQEINASPKPIDFGYACSPTEALESILLSVEPQEFFVEQKTQEDGQAEFILFASQDRKAYTLLYRLLSDNPRDLSCAVEVNAPLNGERDARN